MTVSICVGTSCHIRGSRKLIDMMKAELKKNKLEDKVELQAVFCLGKCGQGVSVRFDETILGDVNPENFKSVFKEYVLDKIS